MAEADRALVFGLDTQIGLTVVRELAAHGVTVYGVGHHRRAVGLYSRALRRGWVLAPGEEAVDLVNRIAGEFDVPFLIVAGEAEINYFNERRGALRGIRPLIPEASRMSIVINKDQVLAHANVVGIATPQTIAIESPEQVESMAQQVTYPVVLKWADPHAVIGALRAHGIALEKVRYCHTPEELTRTLRRYDVVARYPLIQSFAPGYGLGQMIFMYQGEPLLCFQHRRIHEIPPEGGASSLCESMAPDANPELMKKSVALLRRIDWEGAAMVEYRYDPSSRAATLMEINGRFWGSLPLASQAGAPFAWLTYAVLGKGERPALAPYRVGLRCGFLVAEVKRLHRIVFEPGLIQNRALRFNPVASVLDFVVNQANPFRKHYIFQWSDPGPALADLRFGLGRALALNREAPPAGRAPPRDASPPSHSL